LAPFQGVITNPCPLGMDIEFLISHSSELEVI